jgi:hypothetical protein
METWQNLPGRSSAIISPASNPPVNYAEVRAIKMLHHIRRYR